MPSENLLEGNLAVELCVECDEYGTQAAGRVGPEHAKPLAWSSPSTRGVAGGPFALHERGGSDPLERGFDLRLAQIGEALERRLRHPDCCETFLDFAAVLSQVTLDQRLDGSAVCGIEVAANDEMVGQTAGLIASPGLECSDELDLVDQAVLESKQAEKKVAGGRGHDVAPISGSRSAQHRF